jgi:hypothetical protein
MPGKILISTACLPPIDYMKLIAGADEIVIEQQENFIKQTYRNRFYILSAHGRQLLTIPVLEGSRHKVNIREARIDYSKRWQQVHLRAMISSYRSSPYFDYYFGSIESIISSNHEFLFDLNSELLECILKMLGISKDIKVSLTFEQPGDNPSDFRYVLVPGNPPLFPEKEYLQVFDTGKFIPNLSIVDLIFNQGPEAGKYL